MDEVLMELYIIIYLIFQNIVLLFVTLRSLACLNYILQIVI